MQLTALILTYNEAPNIDRVLSHLGFIPKIVVIDSGSTDETLQIVAKYTNVEVFTRPFDTHAKQWNFGLDKVTSDWVLTLDADYVIDENLAAEIQTKILDQNVAGYFIPFKYCVFGKPLRSTILPDRLALFQKAKGIYIDDGHTQLLELSGRSEKLINPILHDDRKALSRWLWAQDRYMKLEVEKIISASYNELSTADKIRKLKFIAPFVVLLMCLFVKKGILDGHRGIYYAFQRCFAEMLLSLKLMESEGIKREER